MQVPKFATAIQAYRKDKTLPKRENDNNYSSEKSQFMAQQSLRDIRDQFERLSGLDEGPEDLAKGDVGEIRIKDEREDLSLSFSGNTDMGELLMLSHKENPSVEYLSFDNGSVVRMREALHDGKFKHTRVETVEYAEWKLDTDAQVKPEFTPESYAIGGYQGDRMAIISEA